MRYTEYEFKLDHVFDFIRLIFSSIFLAPFRLVNEISKKVIYLDKTILEKVIIGSAIVNAVLILANIGNMIFTKQLHILDGHIPLLCELISLALIAGLYYLVFIHEQPVLKKATKKKKVVEKEPEKNFNDFVLDEEELISDDDLDDVMDVLNNTEPHEVNLSKEVELDDVLDNEKVTEEKVDPLLEKIDKALGNNFQEVVKNADTAMFREDEIEEAHRSCQKAIEEDEFGIGDLLNSMPNLDDSMEDLEELELPDLDFSDEDLLKLHMDDETPIEL